MDIPGVEQWREWKRMCAADLCAPATRSAFRRLGYAQVSKCLAQVGRGGLPEEDCWHRIEMAMWLPMARCKKRVKDHMFEACRGAGPGDLVPGRLGAYTRRVAATVVRDLLTHETRRLQEAELDAPILPEGDGLSLRDLLGDPHVARTDEQMDRDIVGELAVPVATRLVDKADAATRIMWVAHATGHAESDERVMRAAEVRNVVLGERRKAQVREALRLTAKKYPNESDDSCLSIAKAAIVIVMDRCVRWARATHACDELMGGTD